MTVTIFDLGSQQIATFDGQPLARVSDRDWGRAGWSPAQRLDPGTLVPGCPAFLVGKAILQDVDVQPAVPPGKALSASHDGGVADLDAGLMVYTWTLVQLPTVSLKAAWAAERDRLIAEVKTGPAGAEAARMRFLTNGAGKALTYEAKRHEVQDWMAETAGNTSQAPATPAEFPFANAEATETSQTVLAVLQSYKASADAYVSIGATIEAREQGACKVIRAQHDAAMAAYDLNNAADLSGYLTAMRAAAVVTWPSAG